MWRTHPTITGRDIDITKCCDFWMTQKVVMDHHHIKVNPRAKSLKIMWTHFCQETRMASTLHRKQLTCRLLRSNRLSQNRKKVNSSVCVPETVCQLTNSLFAVKLSATDEIQVDVAPSPKRKTLYTLVNEIIEETPENVIEKEVHLEMNQEVNAGTHFSITGPSVVDHQQLQSQMAIETTSAEAGCGHSIAALNPSIPNEKPDEFDLFGKLMAEIMRKMSKSQSRKLQLKIMGVINEIENTP